MAVRYNRDTWWVEITDPVVNASERAIEIPLSVWRRILTAPEPVYGFSVERDGVAYRMASGAAQERVRLTPTTALLPLDDFHALQGTDASDTFLYLGAGGTREADAGEAIRIVAAWGHPPSRVRTGWDVSDEVIRRVPNISRSHIWPHWTRLIIESRETVVVPRETALGTATASVVEKVLGQGRKVLTAETPPHRVVRVGRLAGGDIGAITERQP